MRTTTRAIHVFVVAASACVALHAQSPSTPAATYFPAEQWRTATPESQGIDSVALASAIDQVREQGWGVHSLLVIRHGFAVADVDFYPYSSAVPHDLASVTKTVTSTLTGIAVGHGVLTLDQKVLSFFPADAPADADERKRAITVGNLLHMESGLDCGFLPGEQELEQMKRSANWVRYALSLPVKYDAGTRPAYCSPGYHLLGSVIGAAARTSELAFGQQYLFGPLGMRDVVWADDPQGRSHGWGDSHFYPRDVAKLGYLYLHGGMWNGAQIVPKAWVDASITPPPGARTDPGGFGIEWNVTNGANGRQYGGTGRGGQSLVVWPELDMVVVSMAGGNAGQFISLIRQAVKSDQPLAPNAAGDAALKTRAAAAALPPAATSVTAAPAIASSLSGQVFTFPVNPSRIDSLALTFDKSGAARLALAYYGEPLSMPVGLDGVYPVGPYGPFHLPAAAMGRWTSDTDFLLDVNFIANINHYTLAIHVTPAGTLDVTVDEASGLMRNGHLTGTPAAR